MPLTRSLRRSGQVGGIMTGAMATTPRSPLAGLPAGLARRRDERAVAGVCAGIARWIGVDPLVVRLATVILALANGVGVVAYLVAWAVLPLEDDEGAAEAPARAGRGRAAEMALGVGCVTLGALLLVRWVAPFFPDGLVWPAAIGGLGIGVALARAGDGDHRWRELAARLPGNPVEVLRGGAAAWVRIAAGAALLVVGLATFLATNGAFASLGAIGVSVVATALGGALILGPWFARLVRQLGEERRERIRSEERADMAAHLHDSVLQTLALIQRHADSPPQARSLARRQERELRAWLYDDRRWAGDEASDTLAAALDRLADEVEADHGGAQVEVVTVSDCPLDPGVEALVKAAREAVVNAVRHSGAPEVSVYAEVAGGRVEAFVRDRGRGFDPATVDGDRHGIARSIVARMARHGGRAEVTSAPGEGTEVALSVACEPEPAQ
jgi:signal transduction histidine kinase/phage shock protein PspC (stress-responsive transcriptional regulator)